MPLAAGILNEKASPSKKGGVLDIGANFKKSSQQKRLESDGEIGIQVLVGHETVEHPEEGHWETVITGGHWE